MLTVPIRVHAIFQEADEVVVGPEMDFESLPYFDEELELDMNPDVPYLAESVIPRPFEDTNFLLKKGVHLNWDFPKFLKSTAYAAKHPTQFPPVPTRWLISRFQNGATNPDAEWIVESDALLNDLQGAKTYEMAQTSLPVDIHSGERPYTYMGRIEKLEEWKKRGGKNNGTYVDWRSKHPIGENVKEKQKESLTALGWGSPTFDTFYPNCQGVFGFHDPEGTKQHDYKIIGWYDRMEDDYWLVYLKAKQLPASLLSILPEHLLEERKQELKKERFVKTLKEDLGIELDYPGSLDPTSPASWERMLCCGESQWLDPVKPNEKDLKFAMGNTPVEALSAMIAENTVGDKTGPAREMREDTLSAMLMGDRLKAKKVDIGPKFREFRHSDEFAASDGGIRWVIEKVSDDPHKQGNDSPKNDKKLPPPLPKKLLPFLEKLNAAQREYDRVKGELESCRFELYADWYRYMHAAYPPPGETEEYVDLSEVRIMIEEGSLKKVEGFTSILEQQKNKVQKKKDLLDKEIKKINAEIAKKQNTEDELLKQLSLIHI